MSGDKTAAKLLNTMDAMIWAKEFLRIFEDKQDIDLDLMHGWFANAIMTGHDIALHTRPAIDAGEIEKIITGMIVDASGNGADCPDQYVRACAQAIADKRNEKPADHGGDDE